MAAEGDVIKSFLVGLGFDVDESSLAVFNKAIQTAAIRVTALYTAVNAFAASMVYAFSKISEGFEEMGYQYHIIAPAINKAIVLRQELLKAYGAAGINIRKVIVDSIKLNMSLAKTKFAMEAIYKSVGSRFFGLMTKASDNFRKKLYDNMPYIINALETLVKTVFKAFEAVTILGGRLWSILSRVYDFFVMLDKATDGWSTVILGVIAAWKLLNLSFLATPLGLLFSLATAVLALYDDFKTFQEGGKSLINWGSDFTKMLVGLTGAIATIVGLFYAWKTATSAVSTVMSTYKEILKGVAIAEALAEAPLLAIIVAITSLITLLTLADEKWKIFGGNLSGFFGGIGDKIMNFVGGGGPNLAANQTPLGSTPPAGATNVNAKMQTQINITGSPNADATARATAQQQQNVNRDMTRNLKGITR